VIRTTVRSLIAVVVLTIFFGGVYPLAVTGISAVAFSHEANGSLIKRNGVVVGSRLDGQSFTAAKYFHSRPSATTPAYNPTYSTFANLGPTSSALADQLKQQIAAVLKSERPYNPGLTVGKIPVDAVTTSGSGLDPDITPAAAYFQVPRVAKARGLSAVRVHQLIDEHITQRQFGVLGEARVNVLALNLDLDKVSK